MAERAIEPNDPTVPGSDPEHPTTGQVPIVSSVDGPRPPIPAEIWVLLVATLAFTLLYAYLLRVRGILAAREEAREERELMEDLKSMEALRG